MDSIYETSISNTYFKYKIVSCNLYLIRFMKKGFIFYQNTLESCILHFLNNVKYFVRSLHDDIIKMQPLIGAFSVICHGLGSD